MLAEIKIAATQLKNKYPIAYSLETDLPPWQIDYEKYGGYSDYLKVKDQYWSIADYYLHSEKYTVTNFPLEGHTNYYLLLEFRNDIKQPIRYYE